MLTTWINSKKSKLSTFNHLSLTTNDKHLCQSSFIVCINFIITFILRFTTIDQYPNHYIKSLKYIAWYLDLFPNKSLSPSCHFSYYYTSCFWLLDLNILKSNIFSIVDRLGLLGEWALILWYSTFYTFDKKRGALLDNMVISKWFSLLSSRPDYR